MMDPIAVNMWDSTKEIVNDGSDGCEHVGLN